MGQAKKNKRDCPVAGRVITPVECGESRASRYACPASCPHNPWAPENYEHSLAIEDELNEKLIRRLAHENPGLTDLPESAGAWQTHNYFLTKYQLARDAAGRSFLDRWQSELPRVFNNDERVLLTQKWQSRLGLLEIHRVLDAEQCEVVDLLAPAAGAFIAHDRSLATVAVRFSQILMWYYPLPHYWRMNGVALHVPEVAGFDGLEVLQEVVHHLGGPVEPPPLRDWLAGHYAEIEAAFQAVTEARHDQMLNSIDARFSKATYRLRGTAAEMLRRLAAVPSVADEAPGPTESSEGFHTGRVWFDEPAAPEPQQLAFELPTKQAKVAGRPVLGRVLVADDRVRIEAGTNERYQALRAQFEKQAGRLVEFTEERVDDLAAQLRQQRPVNYDAALVPPRLLENPARMRLTSSRVALPDLPAGASLADATAQMMQEQLKMFLADTVPLLGDRTPAQAAADPVWRPKLLVLLKQFVRGHDQRNLEAGRTDDINWLLRELGVTELLFDPPPRRAPRPPSATDGESEGFDLPQPPPLPARPLTEDEVFDRLEEIGRIFPSPEEMLDCFEEEAVEVVELIDRVTKSESDAAYDLFILVAGQIWYVFFPPGTEAVPPDLDRLRERWLDIPVALDKLSKQPNGAAFERHLAGERQPNLVKILAAHVVEACAKKELRREISKDTVSLALTFLRALTDELDETLREFDE